ncbi:MAG: hypothetical protein ABJB40_09995 [Acidobacteriota bacterium]
MRRSLILSAVLVASTAVLGACDPKVNTNVPPNKPVATPSPVTTVSPVPTTSPEVKGNTKTEVKPVNGKDPAALGNDAHPADNGKIKEPKPAITATPHTK